MPLSELWVEKVRGFPLPGGSSPPPKQESARVNPLDSETACFGENRVREPFAPQSEHRAAVHADRLAAAALNARAVLRRDA